MDFDMKRGQTGDLTLFAKINFSLESSLDLCAGGAGDEVGNDGWSSFRQAMWEEQTENRFLRFVFGNFKLTPQAGTN
jgi:hypothetical protein